MRYAEYVQRLDYLPISLDDLENILNSRPIKQWSYLVHDKDTYEDGTLKPAHIHVEMKLNSDQTAETISSWFNDKPERIEKGKSSNKAFMWPNMNLYLVHDTKTAIEGEKYRYEDESVRSNFDFIKLVEDARLGIKEAKEHKKSHPLADVLQDICDDKIPRIKLSERISDMERIKYDKDIQKAYAIRDEKKALEVDRTMNVMYFYGPSGTGKTTLAKTIGADKGYSVFVSGSSNDPLQGYMGQECVILDDIRGSDWKINDLLKLLDNHTNSLVKSRYSNKLLSDCKLMILTSVEDIDKLYQGLSNYNHEPIEQLKRRCSTLVQFTENRLYFYEYSEGEKDYKIVEEAVNPVPFMEFISEKKSYVDDMVNMVKDLAHKNGVNLDDEVKSMEHVVDTIAKAKIVPNDKDLPFD